jgi:hypothetical protein
MMIRILHRSQITALSLLIVLSFRVSLAPSADAQSDPLPSWSEVQPKSAIIAFVQRVTKTGGPDFVPMAERIATFDNDGTLWVEKPLPNELYFVLSRVKELAAKDPGLRERQPYKAALEGDAAYFHEAGARAVVELLVATHSEQLPELDSINDKDVKPVNIDRQIGLRPIVAGGNVGNAGDIAMMEYSKGRTGPSFQLLINHDDDAREFAYAERDNFSLDAAKKNGFTVVNIKSDWKTVFVADRAAVAR